MRIEHVSIETDHLGNFVAKLATNGQEFESTGETISEALFGLGESLADEGL